MSNFSKLLMLLTINAVLYGIEPLTIYNNEEITLEDISIVSQDILNRINGYKHVHIRNSDFDPSVLFKDTKLEGVSLYDCKIPTLSILVAPTIKAVAFENVRAKDGTGFKILNNKKNSISDLRLAIWNTKVDSLIELADVCQEYDIDISIKSADHSVVIPLLNQLYKMSRTNPNFTYRFVNGTGYPNHSDESGLFYTEKPEWWNGVDIAGFETLRVTDNKVRLRKEPSLKSPILGLLNKGSRLLNKDSGPYETMLGYDKNSPNLEDGIRWVLVYSYELKAKGYISIEFVESMNGLFFP